MTSIQIILHCHNKHKNNRFFVAPVTILKQFEQDKINYKIEKDTIYILEKQFKIERSANNAC